METELLIIGGGINGAGIARDAAGRGYRVMLVEQGDLASATSSWSTKLIHGGLRYLEHYEFQLVRAALKEREVLWALAPHLIRPLRFVLPHHKGLRPAWLLRLGLFLYDHLGGRKRLPATQTLDLRRDPAGVPLQERYGKAFEYSDCRVDDARLVVLNARDAADRGAAILTQTRLTRLERQGALWRARIEDRRSGEVRTVTANLVINAAGPWVDDILRGPLGQTSAHHVRLVQGSHILVKRLFAHDKAYIFQNADQRIVFAIPFEEDFTLIGTTDRDYQGDPGAARISEEEITYLLASISEYFKSPVGREAIVWSYSGVRPLFDDGASKAQEATRDYIVRVDGEAGEARLINIFGGKITTYRRLAEIVLEKVAAALGGRGKPWTAGVPLPGGDFPQADLPRLIERLSAAYPDADRAMVRRLVHAYGTRAPLILDRLREGPLLRQSFGAGLTAAEVRYLIGQEWARSAEDILWRRSKLGLRLSLEEKDRLEGFVADVLQEGRETVEEGG